LGDLRGLATTQARPGRTPFGHRTADAEPLPSSRRAGTARGSRLVARQPEQVSRTFGTAIRRQTGTARVELGEHVYALGEGGDSWTRYRPGAQPCSSLAASSPNCPAAVLRSSCCRPRNAT